MLNKNKILIAGVVGGIAVAVPDMAKAQTFYQCMPKTCGANEILSNGNCYSTTNSGNWTLLYDKTSGEGSATLSAGTYVVAMHGGNGGDSTYVNGALGGNVFFQFTEDKSWTFKYGVGQNGTYCKYEKSTGGGGGSWISINGQYIVAGGGGGGGYGGGAGGAVGAGSASITNCLGGKSGNYSNNNVIEVFDGESGAEGSEYDTYISCTAGSGINDYNAGTCTVSHELYNPKDIRVFPGTAGGIIIYPGSMTTQVGGYPRQYGMSTHNYNTNANVAACSIASGCVKLYKFNK